MDLADPQQREDSSPSSEEIATAPTSPTSPRKLPDDLPTSLDDRRAFPSYSGETEMYDAWQGQSQFLTTPVPAKPLAFNLGLDADDNRYNDEATTTRLEDSETRLMEMLAARTSLREDGDGAEDEDAIITDEKLSRETKQEMLQKSLTMAASNGDVERVTRLLNGPAREYVDVNMADEEGTAPLIYASCFGHQEVVSALLDAGAHVDKQDRNQWSALMWAMTNRHKTISKILLDHGASPDVKSSSGRTAFDFVTPNSELSEYLHESGYHVGGMGFGDDFYDSGFSQDRFEEEMAENEMKRRMMMESAINLEVDLSSLGLDEKPEPQDELEEDQQEFVWDRCLNDQMFVFQESELDRILDIIITNMTPQRTPSQKPVPANILFLSARYAHYHATPQLLATLMVSAMDKINDVVERSQWDMTILAFWVSNATLLLHYLKKDPGLTNATPDFQIQLSDLINEIFILIIRDAERRMNKFLDAAMLDHETIPGFEDVHFQHEWNLFRSKTKVKEEPIEKRYRPPSPKRRAQVAPRNILSLLSSTLFVLDLYDIHSVITSQILAQLLYWLGAELFNRIMTNRRYLARTKAMQIRMNVSFLEDWARSNNRQPEHYENGSTTSTGENTVDAARRHLAPVIQLLQWLQCFSSLGEDFESLVGTLQQLTRMTPQQLIYAVKHYRPEVGEKGLPRSAMKYLLNMQVELDRRKKAPPPSAPVKDSGAPTPSTPTKENADHDSPTESEQQQGTSSPNGAHSSPPKPSTPQPPSQTTHSASTTPVPLSAEMLNAPFHPQNSLLLDPALMLPFSLPTSTDMLVTYGAGFGGTNRERERKYIPTVPPEFLAKLDAGSSASRNEGFHLS